MVSQAVSILITGSKEYPFGTNKGDDPISSGGIEVYTTRFVSELSKNKNIKIKIITRKFESLKEYEKSNNIEVYRVPWIKGFFLRNISFNFFAFLKALQLNFDILFATGPFSVLFSTIIARLKQKKQIARPAGISCVQPQYSRVLKYLLKHIETMAYKGADVVIFLSEEEKTQFRNKLGFLPDNCSIIPTGINMPDYENVDSKRIEREFNLKGKIVITFIGRLLAVKGIDYLIESLEYISKKNIVLLIVGDGPDRKKLESAVNKSEFKENIIFTGQRYDIPQILAATDIFVIPSLSEGLPAALLEAMASGIPCIVTDIGLPVESNKNAIVVPPKDVKALAYAINKLVEDKKLASYLGRNAKEHIRKNFSWDYAVKSYIKIIDDLQKNK